MGTKYPGVEAYKNRIREMELEVEDKAPNGANRTKKALHRTAPRKFRSKPYGRGLAPNRTTKPWCTDSLYGVFTISCNRVFDADFFCIIMKTKAQILCIIEDVFYT